MFQVVGDRDSRGIPLFQVPYDRDSHGILLFQVLDDKGSHGVPLFQVPGDTDSHGIPLFQVPGDTDSHSIPLFQVPGDPDSHGFPLFQVLGAQETGRAASLPAVPPRVVHVLPRTFHGQLHAEVPGTAGGEGGTGQAGHWNQTYNVLKALPESGVKSTTPWSFNGIRPTSS